MLSNCINPVPGDEDVVEHWYNARPGDGNAVNGKVLKRIPICFLIRWYRKLIGAVD
jgi:hypothetical protein